MCISKYIFNIYIYIYVIHVLTRHVCIHLPLQRYAATLVVRRAGLENFPVGNFCKAQPPRSVSKARRGTKKEQKIMVSFLIHAVSLEPRRSTRACFGKFLAGKFLQSTAATQRFKSKTGNQKRAKNHGQFSHSRCFVRTCRSKGLLWKTFLRGTLCKAQAPRSISKERRRTKNDQKLWEVFSFALFRRALSFEGLAWKNFSRENFCKSQAPRSVSEERR